MTLKALIKDGSGAGNLAGVSIGNELIVGGVGDNITVFKAMNVTGTAFKFFNPISDAVLFITSILLSTPAAATNIDIYEASSATSTVIDKEIISINTSSKQFIIIPFPFGGFPSVTQGEFLNAKTDNATVNMTIIGYYRKSIA